MDHRKRRCRFSAVSNADHCVFRSIDAEDLRNDCIRGSFGQVVDAGRGKVGSAEGVAGAVASNSGTV